MAAGVGELRGQVHNGLLGEVVAAMKEILCAIAAAGRPAGPLHAGRRPLTGDRDTTLRGARAHAGIESRPAFKRRQCDLRPSPSRERRLAAGTRTLSNLVRPFSMPFRPIKALRRSTVIPTSPTRRRGGDPAATVLVFWRPGT